MGLPRHWRTHRLPRAKVLHVQGRLDQVRNMFNDNLPSDIETTKGTSFDDVTWIVDLPG